MNRFVDNLAPMPGVFPDYPAPVVRNAGAERELVLMRWGMPPPQRTGGPPVRDEIETDPRPASGLRLSHDVAERRRRTDPSESHASHSDAGRGT
jgi:putative SOS response-associated peptidase YedK